jgi:hypothetical protein
MNDLLLIIVDIRKILIEYNLIIEL